MSGVLAVVPARGGSKGLPGKNLRPLAGRSLVARAVDIARQSGVVDRVIVSTDAPDIADEARRAGADVPFLRPADLARDDTPMLSVLHHVVVTLDGTGWTPEIIVLLQPTSPLRRVEHVREAVQRLRDTGADSVVSVVELPRHLSPDYVMRVEDGRLVHFLPEGAGITRRQDARVAYLRDGTVYVCWRRTLMDQGSIYGVDSRPIVISAADSLTIDTEADWADAARRIPTIIDASSAS